MSPRNVVFSCLVALLAAGLCSPLHASKPAVSMPNPGTGGSRRPPRRDGAEKKQDETLSPYFFVKSDDPEVDKLPLKKTTADVNISGVIAKVRVTQVYKNEGERPIEAKYVFPASTRAAVHGLKMKIGERTIVAEIDEREEAREKYEEAKEAGKTTSLLEQERPNVFQMNVANIMPDDVIEVELVYTEMLVPENGEYSFVYPTVVGPRYSETPAHGAPDTEKWVESPYLHSGEEPTYTFDMNVNLSTGIPLKKIACTSHDVNIDYEDPTKADIGLADDEKHGGNRDFILKYVLAQNQIETGLMLHDGKEENFFTATVQPPKRVEEEMIPPREYIFIVDVSGSMNGFPLDISKELMSHLLDSLRPKDHFNVVFFAGGSFVLNKQGSLPATKKNVKKALKAVNNQRGGGGTRLLEGLKTAYDLPRVEENVSRTVVLATDGYVSVEQEAFDIIKDNLGNTNVFGFGIGSSVNRYLIRGVAKCGKGEEFVVTKQGEASEAAEKFEEYVSAPLLTGIDVSFEGFDAYDVEPPNYPDIFAERPLVITGKYRNGASGDIHITGHTGKGDYEKTLHVGDAEPSKSSDPLKYVWVRKRIARLSDYVGKDAMEENKDEVTRLGLKYSLLTRYTSFVAIDKRVRRDGEELETVKQPLPMPKGVSDLAVGGGRGGAIQFSGTPAPSVSRAPAGGSTGETADREVKEATQQRKAQNVAKLARGQKLKVDVTTFKCSNKGGLTARGLQNAFARKASNSSSFKKVVDSAGLSGQMVFEVQFKNGKSTGLTFRSDKPDGKTASRLAAEVRSILDDLASFDMEGRIVMELTFR